MMHRLHDTTRQLPAQAHAARRGERLPGHRSGHRLLVGMAAVCWSLILAQSSVLGQEPEEPIVAPVPEIPESIVETLSYYCVDCHSGSGADADLMLDAILDESDFEIGREKWEKVLRMSRSREMPPEDSEQPEEAERLELITWITERLNEIDCEGDPFPGRVTIRRLNRAEYNNTIRDLTGVDFKPADDFPSDDVGNGFDNIGDVLAMPPLLVEKYLDAAKTITDRALEDKEARKLIIICEPANDTERLECATRIIRHFATRAFRRPVTDDELQRLVELGSKAYQSGLSYDDTLKYVMQAVLVSPNFLFKVEMDPAEDELVRSLDDFEIATRLSYFLWSSMPDEELYRLARDGELQKESVLVDQIRRMLADPKSEALVENFAGQWLQLRRLADVQPDPDTYAGFDEGLKVSMRGETEAFFRAVMQENRSVLDFLVADFSFIDQRLADHYGLPKVEGEGFQRVKLPDSRRGVLTHGSILLITSNPTRTSPVKRGKWIMENFLGESPPPPPDGVQELEEQPELLGSLRERMEQHRENPACGVCHRTMDVLGFGLENFDGTGAWRDQDGRHSIDPSGSLPGGLDFETSGELMQILAENKQEDFCRCLTEKMLTYALGRGLQTYDRCTVDSVLDQMEQDDFRFVSMIQGIVLSEPFLNRASTREKP